MLRDGVRRAVGGGRIRRGTRHRTSRRTGPGLRPDAGTAPIEFVFGTTVLLLPLLFLIVSLAQVQAGLYAAQSSAIDAARTASRFPADAQASAQSITRLHFQDHGLEDADWEIDLHCSTTCTTSGAPVTATVTAKIPIPGIPAILGETRIPLMVVRSSHTDLIAPVVE